MSSASIKKIIPCKKDQLIEMVLDIEKYPEFVPWCIEGKIFDKNESLVRVEDSSTTKINILANGPLIVHGTIQLEDAEGNVTEHTHKTALCRCGASGNKPFCDGSHVKAGFKAI